MREIIEDTISRNRKFQEERRKRVQRLKELKAPDSMIETEEMISKMTLVEYEIYCKQLVEEDKKIKLEYAKNNPIQKSIVDEIYSRESKLEYNEARYSYDVHLLTALDPLSFMSEEDYYNDLYESFLEHAKKLYRDRFKKNFVDERVSKLIRQANVHILPDESEYGHTIVGLKKLIELVVEDCTEEIAAMNVTNLENKDISRACRTLIDRINSNFGIEDE